MKPVIIQFDADENYHTVVEVVTYNMDLKIADHATSIKQSRKVLEKVQQKKIKPDIAIVSPLLGNDFQDGEKLVKKLKEYAPDVKIIAYTIDKEITWGDYLALKGTKDLSQSLIAILEELTSKKFKMSN